VVGCWHGVCLEQGADLHMAQLMPCHSLSLASVKSRLVFTFLVPTHLGSPGKRAVKRVCVCVCACMRACVRVCKCYVISKYCAHFIGH